MQWALGREGTHEVVSETDRRGRPLRTVICMETGLVRNDPVPDDAELARFYAEDYRIAYKGAAKPRRRQILRNFRRVASHVRNFQDVYGEVTQVLDVGAGSGEFAFLMTRLGKTIQAVEPNIPYAAYCREELGLDVRTSSLAPDLFAPDQFDLIRMNHVLEHLNNPVKYLAQIACWLKPGGVLYVETPNIETDCREKRAATYSTTPISSISIPGPCAPAQAWRVSPNYRRPLGAQTALQAFFFDERFPPQLPSRQRTRIMPGMYTH